MFFTNIEKTIPIQVFFFLEEPFGTNEIKRVVRNYGGEKAAGPDGLSFKLLK